jgi:hypothetical protein
VIRAGAGSSPGGRPENGQAPVPGLFLLFLLLGGGLRMVRHLFLLPVPAAGGRPENGQAPVPAAALRMVRHLFLLL